MLITLIVWHHVCHYYIPSFVYHFQAGHLRLGICFKWKMWHTHIALSYHLTTHVCITKVLIHCWYEVIWMTEMTFTPLYENDGTASFSSWCYLLTFLAIIMFLFLWFSHVYQTINKLFLWWLCTFPTFIYLFLAIRTNLVSHAIPCPRCRRRQVREAPFPINPPDLSHIIWYEILALKYFYM